MGQKRGTTLLQIINTALNGVIAVSRHHYCFIQIIPHHTPPHPLSPPPSNQLPSNNCFVGTFVTIVALKMQKNSHKNELLTIHCHKLWKQQIQISPNRSSSRNFFFIILVVEFGICTKRVQNTHFASNNRDMKIKSKP